MHDSTDIQNAITAYVNHLQGLTADVVKIQPGRRYIKVITTSGVGSERVHSFIEKNTGLLYKAATFKAPAKDARFDLVSHLDLVLSVADIYGSFLYKS